MIPIVLGDSRLIPSRWVVSDVFPDSVQFLFVADDAVVVIALPQTTPKRFPPGIADTRDVPCGRQGFEPFHHVGQEQYLRRGGSPWPPVVRLIIRAGTGTRPYGFNDQNTVNMIRHHLHSIHANPGIMHGNVCPDLIDHSTGIVQNHLAIGNLPEQTPTVRRADGNEIPTGRCIVIARSSRGLTLPFLHSQRLALGLAGAKRKPVPSSLLL